MQLYSKVSATESLWIYSVLRLCLFPALDKELWLAFLSLGGDGGLQCKINIRNKAEAIKICHQVLYAVYKWSITVTATTFSFKGSVKEIGPNTDSKFVIYEKDNNKMRHFPE